MADHLEVLVSKTRRRLAAVTLALLAVLVVGIGATTAFVGLGALDSGVESSLQATASATLAQLDGRLPTASATTGGDSEAEEHAPASSDTVVLVLDANGSVVQNRSLAALVGLPNAAAVAAVRSSAEAGGTARDERDVTLAGIHVRLLTLPIVAREEAAGAAPIGYVQAGFVLTLHDRQAGDLGRAIVIVGLAGLLAAAVVTLVVTSRALVPVRAAFLRERRFVADASHELRTPTALIRASAEVLDRESLVADEGRPFVADIVGEADRLSHLVGDLLALTAVDAGPLTFESIPVDLVDVARETCRRASPLALERSVRLTFDEAGARQVGGLSVAGDRDRLIQLFLVLLDNAFRHTRPGGSVEVAVARSGSLGEVLVSDEGPGVPESERERIFEPFARGPGQRSRADGGSGLGLAIARTIAERHRGTIRVGDAPGGGARFTVAIPLR